MTHEEIESRVDSLLEALHLISCMNSSIGTELKKGISGGERKRTSIGYELITNPSLIFLDEPTSGLDSHSAQKLIQMLKQEANRGMTLIASIHSPSAQIFNIFDKVIVLAPGGIKVYYDTPKNVKNFFNQFGVELGKYKNPADELLKFANSPENLDRLKEI